MTLQDLANYQVAEGMRFLTAAFVCAQEGAMHGAWARMQCALGRFSTASDLWQEMHD